MEQNIKISASEQITLKFVCITFATFLQDWSSKECLKSGILFGKWQQWQSSLVVASMGKDIRNVWNSQGLDWMKRILQSNKKNQKLQQKAIQRLSDQTIHRGGNPQNPRIMGSLRYANLRKKQGDIT